MAASTVSSLSRLTVVTTSTRMDLAVPMDMTVSELLATLVRGLGPEVADEGAAAGGFVLQRTGEAPLDPSLTLRACQVGDGELLHLRMRTTQMPEMAFDDVLDAVATGVLTRSRRWTAADTAATCAGFAALLVGFILSTCLLTGPSWIVPAAVCGGLAVLLLGAAIVLDRAYDLPGTSLVAAGLSIAAAFAAGAMAVGGDETLGGFGATQLTPAAAAALLFALVSLVVLRHGVPGFTAIVGAGLLAVAGSMAAGLADLDVAATAAFTAGLALLVSPIIPMAAFKMSRLALPIVPSGSADLRAESESVDGTRVLRQAVLADQYMTGIVVALGATLAGSSLFLTGEGRIELALAGVLGGICLLRARLFTGRAQRLAMLVAGAAALLAVLIGTAIRLDPAMRMLALLLPAVGLTLVLIALVVVLPGRRYAPPSGRAADLVESLLVLSVLPLILGIIGVYAKVREMVA